MIVLHGPDDSLILYKQIAHAKMAAEIANAWQRPDHVPELLWKRLLDATAHHDDGWLSHDKEPTLDEHGQPHDFKFMPMHQHREIWRRSIALAMGKDWLAGLLTTIYAKDLYVSYGQHGEADQSFINELGDLVSRIIQDAIKRGGEDCKIVEPGCLATLMSMFTFWDGLSLTLLGGLPWQADWQYDDGRSMLHVKKLDADAFAVAPWPLIDKQLTLQVPAMEVQGNSWEDRESFHHAIETGEAVVTDVHLRQS